MAGPAPYFSGLVFICICNFLVPISRFYCQRRRKRTLAGWTSDVLFALSCAIAIHNIIYYIVLVHKEMKLRSLGVLTEVEVFATIFLTGSFPKYQVATGVLYIVEISAVKGAFLAFYWDIYRRTERWLRRMLYVPLIFVPVTAVIEVILYFTACIPLAWQWDQAIVAEKGGQHCSANSDIVTQVFICTISMVSDLMIIVLGLLIMRQLKLSRIDIYATIFVVLIGTISLVATVARIVVLVVTGTVYDQGETPKKNVTLEQFRGLLIVSCLEILLAQFAFALPSYRFLLRRGYWPDLWSRMTSILVSRLSRSSDRSRSRPSPNQTSLGSEPSHGYERFPRRGVKGNTTVELDMISRQEDQANGGHYRGSGGEGPVEHRALSQETDTERLVAPGAAVVK